MNIHTEKSVMQWFDKLYCQKKSKSMRHPSAYPIFLDYLNAETGGPLLDVGCGPGWLLRAGWSRGLPSFGFDLSRQAIGLTRLNSPDTRAVVASAVHIPYRDNTFRYITCTGVLEHVPDIKAALQEIMRVSVENASFCIMVPNSRTLYWKIFEKISRAHCQSNENALSLQEWEDVFHGQGLSPEKIFRDEWLSRKLLNILGLKAFPDLIHSIQKILWKLIPLKYSHQFVFIFKVKSDDYKQ